MSDDPMNDVREGLLNTLVECAGVPSDQASGIRRAANTLAYDDLEFAASAAKLGFVRFDGDRMVVNTNTQATL